MSPPSTATGLRVVLADDHALYRDGLAGMLEASGVEVVATVADGRAAIHAVAETRPDVVVMDLHMPRLSGVEATREVVRDTPGTRVLILSVSAAEGDVVDAILAGASGYVLKEAPVDEVVAGIRAAASGLSLLTPSVAGVLMRRVRDDAAATDPEIADVRLSDREREVLGLLAAGRANHEIADRLVISESTARHHISSILDKLKVDNRVQAAVRAVRNRLV